MSVVTFKRSEDGFTLIELLVVMVVLGVVMSSFYSVMHSQSRGTDTAQAITRQAQEARLGLNRMIRDTREATRFEDASDTAYTVKVDFDGVDSNSDGDPYDNPNSAGDAETLIFAYDAASKEITLNGETLVAGVEQIPGRPLFSYSSNILAYDWDENGVTSPTELDEAPLHDVTGVGNYSQSLDGPELNHISNVEFGFEVNIEGRRTDFSGEAQLRNRRGWS
ncbi:MAG: prepilin-type N-terminal cleavage/methylation domain-containing protein [Actinomycetota bacterium]